MKFNKWWWVVAPVLILAINIFLVCASKRPPETAKQVKTVPHPTKVEKQRDGADIWIDMAQEESRKMLWDE